MKVTISIDCDNAAFEDDLREELSRILTHVPDLVLKIAAGQGTDEDGFRLREGNTESLRDLNGNVVGKVRYGR